MKRYRILSFDFDTSNNILDIEIKDDWEESTKTLWKKNKKAVIDGLISKYGADNQAIKIKEYRQLSYKPFSVIAFHNNFFKQIRDSFVMGCYYPALVASCALGERILNQLILKLRHEFTNYANFNKISKKKSFCNWDLAINTLDTWGVLLPEVVQLFNELKVLRHKAIHFNPEIDHNDRDLSLESIKLISNIIESQFGLMGQPWFIKEIRNATFISKKAEAIPFVKHILIPNCVKVGPYHKLKGGIKNWIVEDNFNYPDKEISDSEFCRLLNEKKK
jgi:hypothetical protein